MPGIQYKNADVTKPQCLFKHFESLFDCLWWKSLELVEANQDINQAYSIVCRGTMNCGYYFGLVLSTGQ